MEQKQTVEEAATWKWIAHNYQIADTGDYDGCYEITNGKVSLFTKDDGDGMEEMLADVCKVMNATEINFFIDDSDKFVLKAVDDENKRLWKLIEKHGLNPFEDTPSEKEWAASLPTNSMPGWIDERMDKPKSMYPVIVAAYYGKKLITASDMAYFRDGNWFDNSNDLPLAKRVVRYWMERPEPPNGQ